jgi:hypothetical protein
MEALIHNDHRQQPITSDEACGQYREYLARLEAMIQDQEGVVLRARGRALWMRSQPMPARDQALRDLSDSASDLYDEPHVHKG